MSTISTAENPDPTALHYALSLRTERPIEGCELAPHPYLFLKGGQIDNATRAKLMDAKPHYFVVSWSRGPRRQICQNQSCPRGNTYEPVHWTKVALGGPGLRCAVCEKLGVASHQSLFCSTSCFKAAWKEHSIGKHTLAASSSVNASALPPCSSDKEGMHKRTRSLLATDVADENSPEEILKNENNSSNGDGGVDVIEPTLRVLSPPPDGSSWTPVSSDKSYTPTQEDVGCVIRIEVTALSVGDNSVLAGPLVSFTDPVLSAPRGPPKRQLVTAPVPPQSSGATGARFRIISYNILAEQYATKQAYPYCDSWSLSWPFRRGIIQQELEEAQGDIICLQEVQSDHYELHLSPYMQGLGYDGLFKQKSRETMGNYGKVDGCATFWRRSKFILLENYSIEFNECARQAASALGLDEAECRRYMNRLSRDNVAQVLILEAIQQTTGVNVRQPRQMTNICVVNTHLYSNHLRPDVKLWQTMTLMREVENFALPRDIAVIVCGDFNSEPDSAVHEYLSEGCLDNPHPELEQRDSIGILPDQSEIRHRVDLSSVMGTVLGSEPEFTNYTATFKGTLDYIWYTSGRLRVLAASNMPDANELVATCGDGLPSAAYPSDHIMLCADMVLAVTGAGAITRQQPPPVQQQSHRRGVLGGGGGGGGGLGGGGGSMKKPSSVSYGNMRGGSGLGGR